MVSAKYLESTLFCKMMVFIDYFGMGYIDFLVVVNCES